MSKEKNKWMIATKAEAKPVQVVLGQWYSIDGIKCRLWPNINSYKDLTTWDNYQVTISPIENVTGGYLGALGVKAVNDKAAVLALTLQDTNPTKAQDALNSLLVLYNQTGLNDKNLVTANTMDFLTERLESVERRRQQASHQHR